MSTSISNSFVTDYISDFVEVFQRRGGKLKAATRHKDNVVGSSTTFQKIGTGTATTKARHGLITPMNQTHTAVSCTLSDFYAGDWVDKLDESKVNIDERRAIAQGGAMALGRKVDDQILTSLDGTSQTTVTWTVTSIANIRKALLDMVEAMFANDVPDDGMNYGVLTSKAWAMAMLVEEFASADYVGADGQEFRKGFPNNRFKDFLGVKWCMHTGCPGVGTSTAKVFTWNKNAVGYASAANVSSRFGMQLTESPVGADITWHGDRAAHFVNHMMSGGSCLIDDSGVIEGNLDDTAALPTS